MEPRLSSIRTLDKSTWSVILRGRKLTGFSFWSNWQRGNRRPRLDSRVFTSRALQTRSSTAPKNPCQLPGDTEKESDKVVPLPNTHARTHAEPGAETQKLRSWEISFFTKWSLSNSPKLQRWDRCCALRVVAPQLSSAAQQQGRRGQRLSIILPDLWLAAATGFWEQSADKEPATAAAADETRDICLNLRKKKGKLRKEKF